MMLDELVNAHQTQWKWTKGHASHEDNNRCDELASAGGAKSRSPASQTRKRSTDCSLMSHANASACSAERSIRFTSLICASPKRRCKKFALDRILFIPAANPPHKDAAG